jgi:hypothetical protein
MAHSAYVAVVMIEDYTIFEGNRIAKSNTQVTVLMWSVTGEAAYCAYGRKRVIRKSAGFPELNEALLIMALVAACSAPVGIVNLSPGGMNGICPLTLSLIKCSRVTGQAVVRNIGFSRHIAGDLPFAADHKKTQNSESKNEPFKLSHCFLLLDKYSI